MKISFLKKLIWLSIFGILLVSILPNIISNYWLFDIFSNFKLQYLLISIGLFLLVLISFKKKLSALILIIIAVFWNSYFIVPYFLQPNNSPHRKEIKITSVNLLSSNSQENLVIKFLTKEDPDILILMEFTPKWEEKLDKVIKKYEYREIVPRLDNFGIAVLSKYKMDSSIDYFDLNNKPSIVSNLELENQILSVVATHPIPPVNQTTFENRNKQLSNIMRDRDKFSDNLIIAGDFNTSSFSNHFKKLVEGDLTDSRIGFGLLPTWPSDYKILQTTLDHFLVSNNLKVIDRNTGPNIGSDHLPINMVIGIN